MAVYKDNATGTWRVSLYEKQNDLKGQKWKIEKSLER